jgi:hypothetical protein
MTRYPDWDTTDDLVLPECRATVARLQQVLDGTAPATVLEIDPHTHHCLTCRHRIAAAQALLLELTTSVQAVAVPALLTERILHAVQNQRQAQLRRRAYTLAAAASLAIVGVGLVLHDRTKSSPGPMMPSTSSSVELSSGPPPTATQQPVRIGDQLTKASQALRESSRPLTEPAAVAPQLIGRLTDTLAGPLMSDPEFKPARLGDLSQAARNGLEPITGTAQKAYSRLLRDMSAVTTKPKS